MYNLIFAEQGIQIAPNNSKGKALEIVYHLHTIRQVQYVPSHNNMQAQAIIGLKVIDQIPVIIFVTNAEQVLMIGSSRVYEIKNIGFLAVKTRQQQEAALGKIAKKLSEIRSVFDIGFHYYSDSYDLSLPYLDNKAFPPATPRRTFYNQFVWNFTLSRFEGRAPQSELLGLWCVKVMQGYVCQYRGELPGEKVRYIIISRRSWKKTGTRFYARGIDDSGNVANFTQTEQIIYLGSYVFSHLQIRGSVPAFFAQVGVNGLAGDLVIERTQAFTRHAFHLHFGRLRMTYSRVLAINLLSQKKSEELALSNFYEAMVSGEGGMLPYLRYQFYDFHEECRSNKFQNSEALIERLGDAIDALGYSCFDIERGMLVRSQKGVVRTNCLDCLDRTNYVQSRVGLRACRHFLERFSNQAINSLCKEKQLLDFPVNEKYPLLRGFNELWADNGDAISTLYTGIGSTHTDITRTGERTFFGAINHKLRSLMRFYIQFNDHVKHEAMNKLVSPSSPRTASQRLNDFHTILLLSFDNQLPIEQAFEKLRDYIFKCKPAVIMFFVFQKKKMDFFERLKCMASEQTTDFKIWEKSTSEMLEKEYYCTVGAMMGELCWMGVFCTQSAVPYVAQVRMENLTEQISSGQVLLLKMRLQTSTFVFAGINCPSFEQYLKVFDQLHQKGFQLSKLGVFKSASLLEIDYKIVIGNTGAKNILPDSELNRLKKQMDEYEYHGNKKNATKALYRILDGDQFSFQQNRQKNCYLRQYTQGPVQFIPCANRMVFWNEESAVLRVKEYQQAGQGSIVGVLEYQIGRMTSSFMQGC